MKEKKMIKMLNMGTAIGLSTAVFIVLGAFLKNVVLCLCIGAGIGVVIGAIHLNKKLQNK